MIIWRGWGILPLLFGVLGVWLFGLVSDPAHSGEVQPLGLVVAGIASWFLGQHLNRTVPARRAEAYLATRGEQIGRAVESGAWAPGGVRPASLAEARASGEATLEAERRELARVRNRHTLFFIPMQYVGALMALAGIASVVQAFLAR